MCTAHSEYFENSLLTPHLYVDPNIILNSINHMSTAKGMTKLLI